jgi:hypothetical protein
MSAEEDRWYSVRCVFQWSQHEGKPYEERITLWRARDLEHAAELAEEEAVAYAEDNGVEYLRFAQAYALDEDAGPVPGVEVFSLLRTNPLPPDRYLDAFFSTGSEHEGTV